MDELSLDIIAQPADERLIDRMAEGLDRTIPPGVAAYGPAPLTIVLRDTGGKVNGGLVGESVWDWLHVKYLWVTEARQGEGLGRRLLGAAEAEAERRGLTGLWLNTFSFQAPAFYEKLGYRLFGRIDDFPGGHVRRFYQKRLDRTRR
ncbi:MAG: GNAT family N-acetyltransferase [Rhizobiales bacterium]|nr:GNAT family N-acetyltransferase [Hyphomicrobiales bacterium]